jgi:hypothetical protein
MSAKFAMTTFLGGLAQSRKAPINFVMPARPSVYLHVFHWKAFHENLNTNLSRKSKFPSDWKKCRTFNMSASVGNSLLLSAALNRHTSAFFE